MKNNLSYYRHEVNSHNHWKFKLLRKEYGWEGEGKFWALNNEIAASENCTLNLNHEGRKMSLAVDLDFSPDELDAYILFLSDKCKLIRLLDNRIQTEITQENLDGVQQDRKRKREWAQAHKDVDKTPNGSPTDDKTDELDAESNCLDVQTEQSKVKESKEDNKSLTEQSNPTDKILFSPEAAASETQCREEYRKIAADGEAVKNFILEKRPAFVEPYANLWNRFAAEYGFTKVEKITESRKKKIKTRTKEKGFDFVAIIDKAKVSLFDLTKGWLTFDWVLESEKNYTKLLEGNYDNKEKLQTGIAPVKPMSDYLEQRRRDEQRLKDKIG